MGSYLVNFTVYVLAMCGLIFFAVYIYKKVMSGGFNSRKTGFLSIEESMNINPRKSLLVIKAGEERFLIASDIDKTTLISKLEESNSTENRSKSGDYTDKSKLPPEKRIVDMGIEPNKPIVLETIRDMNPNSPRKPAMDKREKTKTARQIQQVANTVTVEVAENKKHNLTTIKEMAKRINEL